MGTILLQIDPITIEHYFFELHEEIKANLYILNAQENDIVSVTLTGINGVRKVMSSP